MSPHLYRSFSLGLVLAWTMSTPARAELPVPCGACGVGVPFVTHGAAGYTTSGTVGTITQSTDRAILNWQSFNVGTGHRVEFKQPSATSAALNRIHQADPSRILGAVDANGQVLLVNQNGFVFGRDAMVNTRALTASTLRISDDVFNTLGITGAINANPAEPVVSARPALEGTTNPAAQIRIEAGAEINAGERVLIVAPEIINEGTITVPDGQAVLAGAKDKVYLAADSDLRGLLVEVDTGGSVSNLGEILTERGNTTLVGLAVNQAGRVRATTSVNVNGTVRLLARDRATPAAFTVDGSGARKPVATRSGTLTFGPGSVTEVVPDADAATAVDAQPQPKSRIEAMARTVHVQSAATITAPGGSIAITATSTPNAPLGGADRNTRIVVEPGARIDASGARGAEVPMARNQASIRLFGNELAGAPVQRDGVLRGQEITVDLRRGTRVADVSKLYTEVRRDVRERLAIGGDVTLASEGAVVLQPGSGIAFGGGEVRTLEGFLDTTRLIRAGVVIDIADASPDVLYDGLYGTLDVLHRKWGVVDTFNLFETGGRRTFHPGYVEGKDGGSLTLTGNVVVVLNGRLDGAVTRGPWQRALPGATAGLARPFDERPQGSLLAITRGGDATATNLGFTATADATLYDFDGTLGTDIRTLVAEDLLAAGGIGRLRIVTSGRVSLPAAQRLDLGPAGLFDLTATRIEIAGAVNSPGGQVRLTARRNPPTSAALTIAPGARLDVSGTWINEALAPVDAMPALLALDGGRINLTAEGDLVLAAGSHLDVSAGAARFRNATFAFGTPGRITLDSSIPDFATPTRLALDGTLAAFGFEDAGHLSIKGPAFALGGFARAGEVALDLARLLSPAGFGDVTLQADRGDIRLATGTQLDLNPTVRELTTSALTAPSGVALDGIASAVILPLHRRPATSFSATVVRAPTIGDATARVVVDPGARIEVTAGGHIALASDSDILVAGSLVAPGGDISLQLNTPNAVNERGYRASQAIALDGSAVLDVSGLANVFTDQTLLRQGEILPGGHVTLNAQRGYVLGDASAQIRADGAAAVLDLPSLLFPGLSEAVSVPSDGGDIALNAAEGIFFRGALSARAGGDGARGGTLEVALDPNHRDPGDRVADDPTNVLLTQFPNGRRTVRVRPGAVESFAPGAAIPLAANGLAALDPATVLAGEFANLSLDAEPVIVFSTALAPGEVRFADGVSLALPGRLDVDAAVISATGARSVLRAPQMGLGPRNTQIRATAVPVAGDGRLTLAADHLDLRNHVWFDRLTQAAGVDGLELLSRGDVRATGIRFGTEPGFTFPGSLNTLANVRIEAARLYPATLTDYAFNLTGANSRLTLAGAPGGLTSAPLSVGGAMTFEARDIVQGGHVAAPFGSLAFTAGRDLTFAAGSVTSVSGAGMQTIFGQNEFGTDWLYPLVDKIRVIADSPAKRIAATAPNVTLAAGATLDLSGGGDFRTFEFVPGPGGPRDILRQDNPEGAFAILPALGSLFGVFDPLETDPARVPTGGTITFAGNGAVPAGTYARLAPRYALLPGALLVTPLADTRDFNGLVTGVRPDGTTVIAAGRLGDAATATREARTSGYLVETGAQVRARAEYNEYLASAFFPGNGAGAPRDAGQVVLNAAQSLQLAGTLAADSPGGRGALVDILGDRLTVTNVRRGTPGEVEILARDLAQFRAANVLLGATRTRSGSTAALDVRADTVRIDDDVTLALNELILAATERVEVGARTRLSATGSARGDTLRQYDVTGDGAFARVSIDEQVTVNRTGAPGAAGLLAIGDATLAASGSITLESSRDVSFAGRLDSPGSLSLAASRFNLGDVTGTPDGLTLTNAQLASLTPAELILTGANGIDLYGNAQVNAARLVFETPGLRGFGAAGQAATLAADSVTLRNTRGRLLPVAGPGTGTLAVRAETMTFGGGELAITGFASSGIALGDALIVSGDNTLALAGDLALAAPVVTATTGAALALEVTGALSTTTGDGATDSARVPGLGAKFSVTADSLALGNTFRLPSGLLSLTARDVGGLTLGAGTTIDLAGRDYAFGARTAGTPGGRLALNAQTGDVSIAAGAAIDVAGGTGGAGGQVAITASDGTTSVSSASSWRGGGAGFDLSTDRLDGTFASLNGLLGAGGFSGARTLALDTGDITIGADQTIDVQSLTLRVNGGSLEIAGNVRAADGLRLFARDDLSLLGGAGVSGTRLVELGTRDGDFAFMAGARIDAGGGEVRLRVPRRGADDVGITTFAGTFERAPVIGIEATRTYASATIDGALIGTVSSDNATYFANAATVRTTLGITGDPRFALLAGVEIASAGNLTLATDWDLLNDRFDGVPGVLTLRAGGNLVLNGNLSDAFLNTSVDPFTPARDVPQNGPSWSYRLIGGAETGAADPLGTVPGVGDVRIAASRHVRTGTGRIDVAAGRDVRLNAGSALYTIGETRGTGHLSALDAEVLLRGDFVHDGGDVTVRAGRDVTAPAAPPLPDYVPRVAGEFEFYAPGVRYPAAWAIDASKFAGIGALGGGNVEVELGGNLDGVTWAIPTSGQPQSDRSGDLDIAGGGRLAIRAGGEVRGGTFHVGRGELTIVTDERLTGLPGADNIAPVFQLAESQLRVRARGGVTLETIFNPTIAEQDPAQGLLDFFFFPQRTYFFTYSADSAAGFESLAGNVALGASGARITARYFDRLVEGSAHITYPGSLRATAYEGDVVFAGNVDLFPSARGGLRIWAGGDVTAVGANILTQSDADLATVPTAAAPSNSLNGVLLRELLSGHAPVPVHALDTQPAEFIARTGTIGNIAPDNSLTIDVAKEAVIRAGTDIVNLSFEIQHARENAYSEIAAGRDIVYTARRRPDGRLSENSGLAAIAGPGLAEFFGGRDVDFGSSRGLESRGNLGNAALADRGADLAIWTGFATPPAFDAFADAYFTGTARAAYDAAPAPARRTLVRDAFYAELEASGVEATRSGTSFARGERAIATLFPGTDYPGDLRSFLSRITTLDGGDIDLMIPGGLVNAGVASTGSLSKEPSQLGVVVQRDGDIRAYTRGDFLVNASRVFALDGGDILIWSALGNIDAGRGARAALSIPPPVTTFDAQGNVIVEFPAAIAGSGIQAAVSTPGRAPGDVFLFAPNGVVNAGDAGISSAGNLTIAATAVLGADNISVGGVSTGVPSAAVSVPVGLASASNAAGSATRAANAAASDAAGGEQKNLGQTLANSLVSMIDVQFLGFGE